MRAETADQALSQHRLHRGRDQIALDAHVDEARDRGRCAVGVERRKDQVTGERRLNRDLGCFRVANLSDHDDVGVLTQNGAQRVREVHTDRGLHLHLIHAAGAGIRWDPRP